MPPKKMRARMNNDLPNNAQALLQRTRIGRGMLKRKRPGLNSGRSSESYRSESSKAQQLSAASKDGQLCDRCKLSTLKLFDPANPIPLSSGRPILAIGSIGSSSECSLCRLFATVHFAGLSWRRREEFHLRCTLVFYFWKQKDERRIG